MVQCAEDAKWLVDRAETKGSGRGAEGGGDEGRDRLRDLSRDLESLLYTNALRATRHSQLFDAMVGRMDQDAEERVGEREAVAQREQSVDAEARALETEREEHKRLMEAKEREVARMKAAWDADRDDLSRCVIEASAATSPALTAACRAFAQVGGDT